MFCGKKNKIRQPRTYVHIPLLFHASELVCSRLSHPSPLYHSLLRALVPSCSLSPLFPGSDSLLCLYVCLHHAFPSSSFFSVSLFRYYFCCLFVCLFYCSPSHRCDVRTYAYRQTAHAEFIFHFSLFFSYGYYYVCVCVLALSDVREKLRRCVSWLVYALTGRGRGARLSVYGCVRAFLLPRPA